MLIHLQFNQNFYKKFKISLKILKNIHYFLKYYGFFFLNLKNICFQILNTNTV